MYSPRSQVFEHLSPLEDKMPLPTHNEGYSRHFPVIRSVMYGEQLKQD